MIILCLFCPMRFLHILYGMPTMISDQQIFLTKILLSLKRINVFPDPLRPIVLMVRSRTKILGKSGPSKARFMKDYKHFLITDGNLTESYGSNFLIVTDGVVRTPTDKSILQGISRSVILELADQLGIPVSYEDLQPYDAYTADEAFLCSTPYCILPVSRVDNRPISNEIPGPITKQLLAAWGEMAGVDIVGQIIHRAKRNV
mgnify:CR=1 FL=1